MTLNSDQKHWAFAVRLIEIHGDRVSNHLWERLSEMKEKRDEAGAQFWIAIADRVRQLAGPDAGATRQ